MTKPGLGRGLGHLMKGDKVAGRPASLPSAPPLPAPAPLSPGLTKLVAAPQPKSLPAKAASLSASEPKLLLPAWFFFAADILLLAFCTAICFDAPKPLDLGHVLFAAASVGLGALLAIVGVLKSE